MEEVITHKFPRGCGKLGGSGVILKFLGGSGKLSYDDIFEDLNLISTCFKLHQSEIIYQSQIFKQTGTTAI